MEDEYNGIRLVQIFNSIGIDLGNVNQHTIDAWFDTDCQDTKTLLKWLCNNISCDNSLTPLEFQEYEELDKHLYDENYENNLEQLHTDYPNILDVERNEKEVDYLKDELQMLLEYEKRIKNDLALNKRMADKLNESYREAKNEESQEKIKSEAVKNDCLNATTKLDQVHKNLQQQICKYSQHINEFNVGTPTFLFCSHSKNYDSYCSEIVEKVEKTIKNPSDFSLAVINHNSSTIQNDETNEIKKIQERILASNKEHIISTVFEESMTLKIGLLESVNLEELISYTLDESYSLCLRENNIGKRQQVEQLMAEHKKLAPQNTNALLQCKIDTSKEQLSLKKHKLEILSQLEGLFNDILSRHSLVLKLLETESNDIKKSDGFFNKVYRYILDKLHNSELRCNLMKEKINQYNVNEALEIGKKNGLIRNVSQIMTNNESSFEEILAVIKKLYRSEQEINSQLFFNDFIHLQKSTEKLRDNSELMRTFLTNGPTNCIVVIPQKIFLLLEDIENLLQFQVSNETNSRQLYKQTKKQLENKWLRMKRQLWMWFETNPTKVLDAIDQIETELKKLRNS